MADKKEFQTELAKLSDEEIRFKRENMSRRKRGWLDEVLENRKLQRDEELERSNKSMRMESLALARKESKSSKTTNRIMAASIVVIIIIAVIGWFLVLQYG